MNSVFALEQDKQTLDKLLANAPVLPNVVSKMLVLDKESEDYYEDVLSLASEDPFIAAKIIFLANSAALAGRTKIETLTQAVVRVGINQVSTLITSISLSKAFKPTQQSHRNLWLHSLQVAIAATKIAQLNQVNGEQAYLSGLLHEIGRFILLATDVEKFNCLSDDLLSTSPELVQQEIEVFGFNSIDVTMNTLSAWHIPDTIASAITAHLLNTIEGYFDPAELLLTAPALDTAETDSNALEAILSIADRLSCIIQQNSDLETLEEDEIETLIRNDIPNLGNSVLFLPPTALAKSLPTIASEAKELATSLGVG